MEKERQITSHKGSLTEIRDTVQEIFNQLGRIYT